MNDRISDAVEILDLEFGDDAEYQEIVAEERVNSQMDTRMTLLPTQDISHTFA